MKRSSKWAVCAGGLLALGGAFVSGRTSAEGIPGTGALVYAGRLEGANGVALSGTRNLEVKFWSAESGGSSPLCSSNSQPVALEQGRFEVTLPDECTAAVHANADVWVEVLVDGSSLGREKAGAVPYAVEAGHASEADFAGSADTLGLLAPGDVQQRVSDSCAAGQSVRAVAADGSVTCEVDNDTTYAEGPGISIDDTTVSVDPAYVQRRITTCSADGTNRAIRSVAQDGTPNCISTVTSITTSAAAGLTVSGPNASGAVSLAVSGLTNGHLASSSVRREELHGTEIQVYEEAVGCGGGLTTRTTCTTLACGHQGGIDLLYFRACDGTCSLPTPIPCNNTVVGWLIDDAMGP